MDRKYCTMTVKLHQDDSSREARELNRRTLLKLLSGAGVAGIVAINGSAPALSQSPTSSASPTPLPSPSVCVPCGLVNSLPVAIMFTGRVYDEAVPLRVALAFEQATDWHSRHPTLD